MSNSMLNATQITSNALTIISAISEIVTSFNISLNMTPNSHRLLEASDVNKDGYPARLSHRDRKLLAQRDNGNIKPNEVVAKDGTGQYKTIAAALAAYPKNNKGRSGIYDECFTVTKRRSFVFMIGDGPQKTMITGRKSNRDGVYPYNSASLYKNQALQFTTGPFIQGGTWRKDTGVPYFLGLKNLKNSTRLDFIFYRVSSNCNIGACMHTSMPWCQYAESLLPTATRILQTSLVYPTAYMVYNKVIAKCSLPKL
ncbi:Pectinesterase, catalytic [Dillenia turbinata]|uniref:Pectinesterase, catalytic n=1 Tax=Dillenia turbinata TaxID=194707 RepID=A0AAN8UKQ7_9MAGN